MKSLQEDLFNYQANTTPHPLGIEGKKAKGVYITDTSGKKYLDFIAGISVCSLGNCHSKVITAIRKQIKKHMHVMVYGEFAQSAAVSLSKELIKNIKIYLNKSDIKKIKEIKIINLWVVRQLKNEYNPIHYHEGQLSGVGYLKIPKDMNQNKFVKNKKFKTNGTIDFINGQKNFLSKSIYNLNPNLGDLLIFPNYLMHNAYSFNFYAESRFLSFNSKKQM